jgi:hypothetical protein
MRSPERRLAILTSLLIVMCLMPLRQAHAYVDPGSGSYILQLLVAAFFGALFAVRVFWVRIRGLWNRVATASFRHRQDRDRQ